ncbi:MAG: CRTAC1 family protein [Gammaproteobacteria bacterium]
MVKHRTRATRPDDGEAIIRRAFRRSVAAIVALLAAAGIIYLLMQRPAQTPEVEEAEVRPPAPAQETPAAAPPPTRFTDITEQAGIDFMHVNGAYGERLMPETLGSGAAFFDYDRDGDQDLFLVNFRYWPDHPGEGTPVQALYRNDGSGHFENVTEQAGLDVEAYGMGVATADYDGDGWVDLFLSTLTRNHLFRNEEGRFREVTEAAGVGGRDDLWSTSAAFLDYDKDGDLDLFVSNYVKWSRKVDLEIDFRLAGLGRAYGAPNNFTGTNSMLYRNEGDGRFTDVSADAGIQVSDPQSGVPEGKGLAVVAVDYDRDGWLDLVVANDTARNFLFHNLGNGTFEEVGALEGLAYDRRGKATGAMGIDAAHFRNDQELGIAIGNFANEMSSLFVTADGRPPFADEAVLEGLGPPSRLALTFGVLFFDYDLDGRLDFMQANGHLEHEINKVQASQHYAQPAQLFWNCGAPCTSIFVPVADPGDLATPMVGRAATYADIDNDGDLDLLITQNGRRAVLFRNDRQPGHHWLRLKLVGRAPNRDAIGARVELTAGGVTQYREVQPTRSYLSQVELPVTFGLGENESVEAVRIVWPDGTTQSLAPAAIDTTLTVTQAEANP